MFKRGRREETHELSLDVAVGRAMMEQLKDDKKDSLAITLSYLKTAYI